MQAFAGNQSFQLDRYCRLLGVKRGDAARMMRRNTVVYPRIAIAGISQTSSTGWHGGTLCAAKARRWRGDGDGDGDGEAGSLEGRGFSQILWLGEVFASKLHCVVACHRKGILTLRCFLRAEGPTYPLPVSKAPDYENSQKQGPKGRYITLMFRRLRGLSTMMFRRLRGSSTQRLKTGACQPRHRMCRHFVPKSRCIKKR